MKLNEIKKIEIELEREDLHILSGAIDLLEKIERAYYSSDVDMNEDDKEIIEKIRDLTNGITEFYL